MKGLIATCVFLVFISGNLFSQAANYSFSSSSGTYTEISGTVSTATGDNGVQTLSLPFSFYYCGENYTTARVCVNGWLELGTGYLEWESSNTWNSTIVKPIIAGLWDDLVDDAGGDIQYTTLGSAPNRIFVVQWKNIHWKLFDGTLQNFQIRLHETTNTIDIIYGTMNPPLNFPSASIGMNDQTGGTGHYLSVTPGDPPTVSSTSPNDNILSIDYLYSGLTYTFNPAYLVVQPDSLGFGYTASGSSTISQTYQLSGFELTEGPIVVTAPDGFEVSLDGNSWSGSLNVNYTFPTLNLSTIYVRFSPNGAPVDYSGNITNVGGSATRDVHLTATSIYNPCVSGSYMCDEFIAEVQVGTIDNISECSPGGYGDYTSISTDIYKTLDYTITIWNPYFYEEDECGMWADWNMDGDFYDAGESIALSGGPEIFTATITPPANAVNGNCRLRIKLRFNDPWDPFPAIDPCVIDDYGEVEDYTLNLLTAPTNPVFNVTPATKDYGECSLNNMSPDYFTQTFTVQNSGPGTLTINEVFLTGGDSSDFYLTDLNTYPTNLSGSTSLEFNVKFDPGTVGPKATTLRIQEAGTGNHDLILSGTGIVYPPQNLTA